MSFFTTMTAQNFDALWKNYTTAIDADKPKTAIAMLENIIKNADKEKAYGHMLKAELLRMQANVMLSPDSLQPLLSELDKKAEAHFESSKTADKSNAKTANTDNLKANKGEAKGESLSDGSSDNVLSAIYNCVLARVSTLLTTSSHRIKSDYALRYTAEVYRQRALADTQLLADTKANEYAPFVVEGIDADIFDGNLLSLICSELEAYDVMEAHYTKAGNRPAACISAVLRIEKDIQRGGTNVVHRSANVERANAGQSSNAGQSDLEQSSPIICPHDSLLDIYGDIDAAGEVAIWKYKHMNASPSVSAKEKMEFLDYAIERWAAWKHIDALKNRRDELTRPNVNISIHSTSVTPQQAVKVKLDNLRNLQSLTMRVYRLQADGTISLDPNDTDDYRTMMKTAKELTDYGQQKVYGDHPAYEEFEDSIDISPLPIGVYLLEFEGKPMNQTKRILLYVSSLGLLAEELPGNLVRLVVVDAHSGQPIAGAKIDVSIRKEYSKPLTRTTLTCNEQGETIFNKGVYDIKWIFPYTDTDRFASEADIYTHYNSYRQHHANITGRVFTDRSIYRPGQTVRMSAVVYRADDNSAVVAGREVKVVLHDANYEEVSEKSLTTDAFGVVTADFTLPRTTLGGQFSITLDNLGSTYFRVEEYKRPTFRVVMPEITDTYAAGDTLHLKAKAEGYSGVAVQGAKVKYTVERRLPWWWSYYNVGFRGVDANINDSYISLFNDDDDLDDNILVEATAITTADGTFDICVPLTVPEGEIARPYAYNFVVKADVTDIAGETQHANMNIPLGSKKGYLSTELPEKVLADSLKSISFTFTNAAGVTDESGVKFRKDGAKIFTDGTSSEPISIGNVLSSGRHTLEAICEDDTLKREFVVFSLADKRPCTDLDEWFYVSAEQFPNDGGSVAVQIGSSRDDIHVVYDLIAGDTVLESGTFRLSNSINTRRFTYNKEYSNGITLSCAWMKNGEMHSYNTTIRKPQPDKRLRLIWTSFRDRLLPGQEEEWTLSITNPDGTPADARLMATLYDKSLDALAPHTWSLNNVVWLPTATTRWATPLPETFYAYMAMRLKNRNVKSLDIGQFAISPSDLLFMPHVLNEMAISPRMGSMSRMSLASNDDVDETGWMSLASSDVVSETRMMKAKGAAPTEEEAEYNYAAAAGGTGMQTVPQLRENFSETAFFAPSISTDGEGRAVMKFTLPESVTTWRFMALAHTKQMFVGSIVDEAVAKKDVMVMPNIPRFVRQGDSAVITTRIANTAERDVEGMVHLTIIDAESDDILYTEAQPFSVEQGMTESASFSYQPQDEHALLICRITAEGEGFSDGEQHYLPVLPQKEMVNKTIAITLNEKGTKIIDISTLFPDDATDKRLTIEYADNPAWFVLQSLPTMAEPSEDNAIELAAALYANSMAHHLIKSEPRLKTLMELWRRETGEEQTLQSSLEKNRELKDILLAETPWVGEAKTESEQKQRLTDFFDTTLIVQRKADIMQKLSALQNADGSWSWWKDMPGSTHMTASITEMLQRLSCATADSQTSATVDSLTSATADSQTSATVDSREYDVMLKKAHGFIDKKLIETVEKMKSDKKKGIKPSFPGMTTLTMLYAKSISPVNPTTKVRKAIDYLLPLLKKDIKIQTIYAKSMAAIVLKEFDEKKSAQTMVESVKEYTISTPDMGRYFDTPKAQETWYSYKIPSHVMAMEAILAVTPRDTLIIEEMKQWLLQTKRTQSWGNAIDNVNAAWAFLSMGGQSFKMPASTADIGYTKTTILNPEKKEVEINKTSDGTSWGAVYAQYMQKSTAVDAHGTDISVKREIICNSEKAIYNNVGDRVVVRITIQAKRDMDFVQVSDRRAACLEPTEQLSGYRLAHRADVISATGSGPCAYYCSAKDNVTNYFFDTMPKGTHVIETEYYVDRTGVYTSGTCTAGSAYAPEFRSTYGGEAIVVK